MVESNRSKPLGNKQISKHVSFSINSTNFYRCNAIRMTYTLFVLLSVLFGRQTYSFAITWWNPIKITKCSDAWKCLVFMVYLSLEQGGNHFYQEQNMRIKLFQAIHILRLNFVFTRFGGKRYGRYKQYCLGFT